MNVLGDSIAAGFTGIAVSPFTYMQSIQARYIASPNAVGGQTMQTIATNIVAYLATYPDADCVGMIAGVNDLAIGRTDVDLQNDFTTIATACRNAKKAFVASQITPRGGDGATGWTAQIQTYIDNYNAWQRGYCRTNRIPVVEAYMLLADIDPTDQSGPYTQMKPEYRIGGVDPVHVNELGAKTWASGFDGVIAANKYIPKWVTG
jgi:lysophospholipase L1-like esterase